MHALDHRSMVLHYERSLECSGTHSNFGHSIAAFVNGQSNLPTLMCSLCLPVFDKYATTEASLLPILYLGVCLYIGVCDNRALAFGDSPDALCAFVSIFGGAEQ